MRKIGEAALLTLVYYGLASLAVYATWPMIMGRPGMEIIPGFTPDIRAILPGALHMPFEIFGRLVALLPAWFVAAMAAASTTVNFLTLTHTKRGFINITSWWHTALTVCSTTLMMLVTLHPTQFNVGEAAACLFMSTISVGETWRLWKQNPETVKENPLRKSSWRQWGITCLRATFFMGMAVIIVLTTFPLLRYILSDVPAAYAQWYATGSGMLSFFFYTLIKRGKEKGVDLHSWWFIIPSTVAGVLFVFSAAHPAQYNTAVSLGMGFVLMFLLENFSYKRHERLKNAATEQKK